MADMWNTLLENIVLLTSFPDFNEKLTKFDFHFVVTLLFPTNFAYLFTCTFIVLCA